MDLRRIVLSRTQKDLPFVWVLSLYLKKNNTVVRCCREAIVIENKIDIERPLVQEIYQKPRKATAVTHCFASYLSYGQNIHSQSLTWASHWALVNTCGRRNYRMPKKDNNSLTPKQVSYCPLTSREGGKEKFSLIQGKDLWDSNFRVYITCAVPSLSTRWQLQFLFLLSGFDIGEEKEENTLKQEELEDKHSFIFTLEGNAVHDPTPQKDCEPLESLWEVPPDELHTDFTKVEDDQNRFLGEHSESSYMEETLSLITPGENSPGENSHQCPLCGNCFAEKSQLTMHLIVHSREEPPKCPEWGESVLCSSHLWSPQQLHTGETPDEGTTYRKWFIQRSHLIGHQENHSKKKHTNVLRVGKLSFTGALKTYMKTHTVVKLYSYRSCWKSFIRMTALTCTRELTHNWHLLLLIIVGKALDSDPAALWFIEDF